MCMDHYPPHSTKKNFKKCAHKSIKFVRFHTKICLKSHQFLKKYQILYMLRNHCKNILKFKGLLIFHIICTKKNCRFYFHTKLYKFWFKKVLNFNPFFTLYGDLWIKPRKFPKSNVKKIQQLHEKNCPKKKNCTINKN